jgi:uncharacterized protein YukE
MRHETRIRAIVEGGQEWGGNHDDLAVWENDVEAVRAMLRDMRPGEVDQSAAAYNKVAARMQTSVELLYNQATKLAEAWGGEAAQNAMRQLQKTYDQANEIRAKSQQTGGAMSVHADMMRSYQANPPEEAGGGGIMGGIVKVASAVSPAVGVGAAAATNDNADEFMGRLQGDTVKSNGNFPRDIQTDMANVESYQEPPISEPDPGHGPGGGGGGGGGSVGGGHLPGAGGGGLGSGGSVGGGHLPGAGGGGIDGGSVGGGHLPGGVGGVGGGGTDLAGAGGGGLPGGVGGGSLGGGAGLGGGVGGGGLPGGGLGAGAGVGVLGGGAGGGAGIGAGAGAGKGAAGRPGMGSPMGGHGGGGEGEEERERSTWLTEDDDVWGGDGDTAPPVIG